MKRDVEDRIEQDGKPVAQTRLPIPVILENYFFFLPPFVAFFFAAMDITSNQLLDSSHLARQIRAQIFRSTSIPLLEVKSFFRRRHAKTSKISSTER
jgi:hypothetical protein